MKIFADFEDSLQDENGYTYLRQRPYKTIGSLVEWRFNCIQSPIGCLCYIRARDGQIIGKYHEHNHLPN